jgi:serine/threonine-protein kinase
VKTTPPPSVPRRPLRDGDIVANEYIVERVLGEGSSGQVWAARDKTTGAKVALKVLHHFAGDAELAERFRREAYFLARTASDHVAQIHDFVSDPGVGMVLVMELVPGESLAQRLDRQLMTVNEVIALGIELLDGVAVLHEKRVLHRDLKPGNIILRPSSDGRTHPVICDFGMSRLAPRHDDSISGQSLTALTKHDMALGTVKYTAPEQLLNARQATERSDLYAVGAILYRAVSGAPPFGGLPTPSEIAHAKVMGDPPPVECGRTDAMAKGLQEVIERAVRRRPAERYSTAATMRAALVALAGLEARALETTMPSPTEIKPVEGTPGTPLPPPSPHHLPPPSPHLLSPPSPPREVAHSRTWQSQAALAAGFVAVFGSGVAVGRASTSTAAPTASEVALTPAPAPTPVPAATLKPLPQWELTALPSSTSADIPSDDAGAAPPALAASDKPPRLVSDLATPPAPAASHARAPRPAGSAPPPAATAGPRPASTPGDDNPY